MYIYWSGYNWNTSERWGQLHENKTQGWYDPNAIVRESDNSISLLTRLNPKEFNIDGNIVMSPNGVGLLSCTEEFSYGIFEIEAKLPSGRYLWPAFWMWSWSDWPPEIDIFEGYSSKYFGYFKPSLNKPSLWNVETNVHYNDARGIRKTAGPKDHLLTFKDPTKHYIKYKLEWTEKSLKFYYDENLVRTVDDPKIMNQMRGHKMNVIINNMIRNAAPKGFTENSVFNIKYFTYIPIKQK